MKFPVFVVLLAGTFIAGSLVTRAVADDRTTCLSNQKTSAKIDACTRAISSGQVSGRDLAGAYNALGVSFHDLSQYDKAIANFNLAIQTAPEYAIAYRNRGTAYQAKSDLDHAIRDFNEAIRLNPQFGLAINDRGVAYYLKGDADRAIADFSEAIRLGAPDPAHYFNRGMAYEKKGDLARALADFRATSSLNPAYQNVSERIKRLERN